MNIVKRLRNFILKCMKVREIRYVRAEISYLLPHARLKGKKIVITGGGRGLGAAMAAKFVAEGAHVLITGRNANNLKKLSEEIGCQYLVMDVRQVDLFNTFWDKAYTLMGDVDILVNNAGISLHESGMLDVAEEQFDNQFATNLKGGYFLAQEFIKRYVSKKQQKGAILFVSSERGQTVDVLPYGLTKAAINSLVQGMAHQFVSSGLRVNAIAPGVTTSDMTGFKADGNLNCDYNITKRVYLPEEVAEIACFLISDAARILNGQILVCNEGKTINNVW